MFNKVRESSFTIYTQPCTQIVAFPLQTEIILTPQLCFKCPKNVCVRLQFFSTPQVIPFSNSQPKLDDHVYF